MKNKKIVPVLLASLCILGVGTGILAAVGARSVATEDEMIVSRITVHWEETEPQTVAKQANNPVSGVSDDRRASETQTVTEPATETEPKQTKNCVLPFGTDIIKDYSDGQLIFCSTMQDWRVHNGVDFGGKSGAAVYAALSGTVTECYEDEYWGTVTEINAGNQLILRYCGLEKSTAVPVGDRVRAGDVVGTLGNIPAEIGDGIHLHFEVLKNGESVDPLNFLNRTGAEE